jgi:hypothetical protein
MAEPEPQSPFDEAAGAAAPATEGRELECLDWCPICRAADVVRATAPPEVREQWQTVQREALLTVRALIDTYLERIDGDEASRGPRVEEIRIE